MLQYLTLTFYTWAIIFAQSFVKKVNFLHKVENVGFLPQKWPKTPKTAISWANLWKLWHFVAQLALILSLMQTWKFQNICQMSCLWMSRMKLLKTHHSAMVYQFAFWHFQSVSKYENFLIWSMFNLISCQLAVSNLEGHDEFSNALNSLTSIAGSTQEFLSLLGCMSILKKKTWILAKH